MERLILNKNKLIDQYVMYTTSDLDGNITDASELFCKISGYTRDELIGKPHKIFRDPDTPTKFYDDLWDTISNDKIWKADVKNITKDGSYYIAHTVISPIFDAQTGTKIGYKSIKFDKTAELELKRKTAEMSAIFHQIELYISSDEINKDDLVKMITTINNSCSLQKATTFKEPELW
jgi:PAS domain S-box-containing protein